MKNLLKFVLGILVMASCSNEASHFTTEGGTKVTYQKKGDGELPNDTSLYLYSIQAVADNGKIIVERDPDNPRPIKLDPSSENRGELFEVMKKLRVGDSVTFTLSAKDFFENTVGGQLPDSLTEESMISFDIACQDQMSEDQYLNMVQEKSRAAEAEQVAIDAEIIDEYLTTNGIEAITTESGLRYVITQEGEGAIPEIGQTVFVNYTGRLLDGTFFDSSVEEVVKEEGVHNETRTYGPFEFPLGQGRVIKGWDEGIGLLNVGTKATFYIPSNLGYGPRSAGDVIKPNSILVFEVELVDAK